MTSDKEAASPTKTAPPKPTFRKALPGLLILALVVIAAVILRDYVYAFVYLIGKVLGWLVSLPIVLLDIIWSSIKSLFGG